VLVRAGHREPTHTHRHPTVMIVDRPARLRYFADGPGIDVPPADGDTAPKTELLAPEGPHSVQNIDDHDCHAFRIPRTASGFVAFLTAPIAERPLSPKLPPSALNVPRLGTGGMLFATTKQDCRDSSSPSCATTDRVYPGARQWRQPSDTLIGRIDAQEDLMCCQGTEQCTCSYWTCTCVCCPECIYRRRERERKAQRETPQRKAHRPTSQSKDSSSLAGCLGSVVLIVIAIFVIAFFVGVIIAIIR
jgi:hypothetical protein